ncbi:MULTISPECIES: hypothetical protein [unclassified Paenibacillus]|uniref:hypothetical protein n=1 Tax=unclassified Paenibacillus TaxID=185978 RepID=UPI001C100EEC|nr:MULTISPECIES: hypothetical protein [unclassified Paenibacillus]MBU5442912.1 hypothetical protein [Paenibacillus sp. MSJ-34]CAH0119541.1 hypothetical protein PAE9249_02045 [Paenibacillus sp. CECT 9249]
MRYNMSLPYFTKVPFSVFTINQYPKRGYHRKQNSISQTKKRKNIKNDSIAVKKMKSEKRASLPKNRDRNPIRKKKRLRNSNEDWKGQYLDSSLNELEWLKELKDG